MGSLLGVKGQGGVTTRGQRIWVVGRSRIVTVRGQRSQGIYVLVCRSGDNC